MKQEFSEGRSQQAESVDKKIVPVLKQSLVPEQNDSAFLFSTEHSCPLCNRHRLLHAYGEDQGDPVIKVPDGRW